MTPNPGEVIAEKYRIDRVLGEGGMGTVYAATNVLTGKQVAIKWLRPELSRGDEYPQRFMREARVASRLEHPNVVNVFDVGKHEGSLFLVMELLHGEPLSTLLARGRPDPGEFARLMMPVLRGVYAAHRMGVVHRDLKPDNIFLCRDNMGEAREPKVLDFGISKLAEEYLDPSQKQLTREGAVFGTPQYMAPEQVRNSRAADARSDVYALGVIFYRALSEHFPYDAESLPALALAIVEGKAIHLGELCPDLPPELADVVMRALCTDPAKRFQSVAEFAQALEPWAGGVTFATSAGRYTDPLSGGEWSTREPTPRSQPSAMGTPPSQRLSRERTPASQPRERTPEWHVRAGERTGASQHGDPRAAHAHPPRAQLAPTPTFPSRNRTRLALGLLLLLVIIALPLAFRLMQRSETVSSAPPRPPVASTPPQKPAPAAEAPVLEPKPAAPKPELEQPLPGEPVRTEPARLEPPRTAELPHSSERSSRRARAAEEHAAKAPPASEPAHTPVAEPAETPPAAEPHEDQPRDRVFDTESNPYLRR